MFVFFGGVSRSVKGRQRYVVGSGLFDWIPSMANVTRAIGSAGNFLSANKDTIKNVADVVGNVAKAGATTASAVKQIVDVVKARRAATAAVKKLPKPLEQVLSQKSIDFLQQLARNEVPVVPQQQEYPDINSRIAGAGFKTLPATKRAHAGKGLLLGPNSPFNSIPILGSIL